MIMKIIRIHRLFAPLFGILLLSLASPAKGERGLDSKEQAYLDESISLARDFLERAAIRAEGGDKKKFSKMLGRITQGNLNIELTESTGACAKPGYGGFVYAKNGKPHGDDIFLCKKAMRQLGYNRKEGAQIVLHELAHLEGSSDECDATFISMTISSLAGSEPKLNGYVESCWPNGLTLGTPARYPVDNELSPPVLAFARGEPRREAAILSRSVISDSRSPKKAPRSEHCGNAEPEEKSSTAI